MRTDLPKLVRILPIYIGEWRLDENLHLELKVYGDAEVQFGYTSLPRGGYRYLLALSSAAVDKLDAEAKQKRIKEEEIKLRETINPNQRF
jgi:hypothetical protein